MIGRVVLVSPQYFKCSEFGVGGGGTEVAAAGSAMLHKAALAALASN